MRRVIVTVVATVLGLVLLLSFKTHSLTSSAATPAVVLPSASASASSGSAAQPSAGASTAGGFSTLDASPEPSTPAAKTTAGSTTAGPTAATPTPTKTASQATRTIDGQAIDTRYGPVQVRVSLRGSTITGITILQVPQDQQRDIEINDYAVPILTQEALKAQNAQIDMVSGATYTSQGYLQSLQSALDQAHL